MPTDPSPLAVPSPRSPAADLAARLQADRWRAAAHHLRESAPRLEALVHQLAAFDRDDVWQGRVAQGFHDELARWRQRLSTGEISVRADIDAAAARIDARAAALGPAAPRSMALDTAYGRRRSP